eukprot:1994467-Alexandrium_andersonii.AAC.1
MPPPPTPAQCYLEDSMALPGHPKRRPKRPRGHKCTGPTRRRAQLAPRPRECHHPPDQHSASRKCDGGAYCTCESPSRMWSAAWMVSIRIR